jgi:uncharacterized protein YjbI with pentapeptide repeats
MQLYITAHIGIILLILLLNSSRPIYNLYDISGLRAIWERIIPPHPNDANNSPKPSSFVLWLIGLYVALFTIASNRYDRAVHTYEVQISNFQTQMASDYRAEACGDLVRLQKIKIPVKPEILEPELTLSSFFKYQTNFGDQKLLLSTVEMCKKHLKGANLTRANLTAANLKGAELTEAFLKGTCLKRAYLKEAHLKGAELTEAILIKTNLEGVDLTGAFIRGANLTGAKLRGANLRRADLTNSKLTWADLTNANLRDAFLAMSDLTETDLVGANLTGADFTEADLRRTKFDIRTLSKAKNLYKTKLPPEAKKELKKIKPELFKKPDWYIYN